MELMNNLFHDGNEMRLTQLQKVYMKKHSCNVRKRNHK